MTRLASAFALLLALSGPAMAATTTVARAGDASVSQDAAVGQWTLTAAGASLTIVADATHDYKLARLADAGGRVWTSAANADTDIVVNETPAAFGSRSAGFTFRDASAQPAGKALHFQVRYDLASAGLRLTRHYAIVSGAPAFETWTTASALNGRVALSDLEAVSIAIAPGTIRYVSGLQGDGGGGANDAAFTLHARTLADGEAFTAGASGRSSEQTVPWLAVDGEDHEFFAALLWSGAWSLAAQRSGSELAITFGLGSMMTTLDTTEVEGPHAVFGVLPGGLAEATAALRAYIVDGLRGGREFTPLVTYNTWFGYGTSMSQTTVRNEMLRAAGLGVELFVIDAGWYAGAGRNGFFDFESGLGSWAPDPDRFPDGFAALSDYAHEFGMKFGIWVEPEHIDPAVMEEAGVPSDWLATSGGRPDPEQAAQICFGTAAARRWALAKLIALVESAKPDYIKWDNNSWFNCDRTDHGHGRADGNFAHVNGLYQVLEMLRGLYPALLVENVAGGGNRLDVGMLRYSDIGWMDDRTTPSVHVRHNAQGLGAIFPPAYLLSFVADSEEERLHGAADLSLYFRSRMQGVLGLSFKNEGFSGGELDLMAREIASYRNLTPALVRASSSLLSPQATADALDWDVLQQTTDGGEQVVISAVDGGAGAETLIVRPRGLVADATYDVDSLDAGPIGSFTGDELMSRGILLQKSSATAAHLLSLARRPR